MRIHPTLLRYALTLSSAAALLGLAPAAAGQNLAPMVGDPVAFRVSLPENWARERDDEMLYVVSDDEEFGILVAALDLVAAEDEPLPVPEAEMRRLLTTMVMGSDSLLVNLLEQVFLHQTELPITGLVQEIGTLGGERAAYLRARIDIDGVEGWFRFYVTVKDGVMYMLGFMGKGDFDPGREPLMGRIHESFALADAPPRLGVAAGRDMKVIRRRN